MHNVQILQIRGHALQIEAARDLGVHDPAPERAVPHELRIVIVRTHLYKCELQTEKQRVIWAYKILFLDVLFPLNLRKVIFVDSDQVIRADFAELWYKDLQVRFPGTVLCCAVL